MADPRAYRRCLAQFATGVAVITTQWEHHRAGVTVNSFSSLSLDPPLVLWSLSSQSRSLSVFERAEGFAVNILSDKQLAVSHAFAGPSGDKFAGPAWFPGHRSLPTITGVLGVLYCTKSATHEGGDHRLFIGRVEKYAHSSGEPLLFAQGRYAVANDHPGLPRDAGGVSRPDERDDDPFSRLVFEAHHFLSSRFETYRRQANLTTSEQKILTCTKRFPGIRIGDVCSRMFLGLRDAEDAAVRLAERGLITDRAGALTLTLLGSECLAEVARRLRGFEKAQLAGIPKDDLATCKAVLTRIAHRADNRTDKSGS